MRKQSLLLFIFSLGITLSCFAQVRWNTDSVLPVGDDLLKLAQSDAAPKKQVTIATFKDVRLINQQTLECLGPRTLNVEISHRFGALNSGSYNAYGIDGPANIRIGLDYSYDGRLTAGVGRTSIDKLYDGYLKYRLIRQLDNDVMPFSVTLYSSIVYTGLIDPTETITGQDKYFYPSDRLSYTNEIMIGRKFSNRFSFQLSGFLVHNNLTLNIGDKNDVYAIGGCVRYKVTRSFALTAEYAYRVNKYTTTPSSYYDSAGIGFEIETGGHVFQIHLTNSLSITESEYIPFTTTSWSNAGIRIGFNISRAFHL